MSNGKKNINAILSLNMLSTFILQGINFITIPIFSRLLGADQYGVYSLFASWVNILTCVMGGSMASAIGPGMYNFRDNYIKFRNSILLCTILIGAVQVFLIFLIRTFIGYFIGFSGTIVFLIALSSFGHYLMLFVQHALTFEKRAVENLFLSVGYSIFSVLLSLVLIKYTSISDRSLGRINAVTISYLFFGIVSSFVMLKETFIGIKKDYCYFGLRVSYPIIFHSLSLNVLIQSDRVMMNNYGISASEIGIYSLFYSLCSVLSVIVTTLNNSWMPFYYEFVDEKKWDILEKKSRNYIELFTVICLGFIMLSREVAYIVGDSSYWSGINIIPFLVLGVYFIFLYQFVINFEFFYKKTKIISVGTFLAAIFNIILNSIMIPLFGIYGAAIATALSYLSLFFAHYYIVTHMKEEKYPLRFTIFVPSLICLTWGVFFFYILSPFCIVRWLLGVILGCYILFRFYSRKSIF